MKSNIHWRIDILYQYVQHKAVAEVSKIANYTRLVAVNHASQSKSTDGSKWLEAAQCACSCSCNVLVVVVVMVLVVVAQCGVV